jgi:hypothetical protein
MPIPVPNLNAYPLPHFANPRAFLPHVTSIKNRFKINNTIFLHFVDIFIASGHFLHFLQWY